MTPSSKLVVRSVLFFLLATVASGAAGAGERLWFGGGIGFGFGDVEYVEVSPVVGYSATEKVSVGGGVVYRYRNDDRYDDDLSTSDYGASVFVRYRISPTFYAHAEYEYLSYEYRRIGLSDERDSFHSVLVGPGYYRPIGGLAGFYAQALYNVSYDEDELDSPYDDEWVYRAGVTFGF